VGLSDATLNGHRCTSAYVSVPAWGLWWADVGLDVEATVTGAATLALGGVTFRGTVSSGGAANGRTRLRIVAGAGGWSRSIPKKDYANDADVKASTVLVDAASAVGETIDATTLPSSRVGPHYVRPADLASKVLELLSPSAWYVGEDGVTRIGARASTTYKATAARENTDRAAGVVTLAPETLSGLVPGVVVDGVTAVDVLHELTAGKLRTTIFGRLGTTSRRLEALRKIFDQLDPTRKYRGTYEYRVVTLAGDRLNLQPVRVSTGMPDLARVPVSPGVAGAKSTLVPGARVLVAFVDATPARPMVVGHEDASGEGFLPLVAELDATTFVKLADGIRPMAATGDLAGGIFPIVGTTRVMG